MKDGDFVNIDFVGKIKESGEVFDLTDEALAKEVKIYNPQVKYGPVTVVLGAGQVIKGLEDGIKKMKVKDTATIELTPENGFGVRDSTLIKLFNINLLKKQNITPIQGHFIDFNGARGRVLSVASGRVRMDFNHPLAGKAIKYIVTLNRAVEDPVEQIKALVSYYTAINDNLEVEIGDKTAKVTSPLNSKIPKDLKEKIVENIISYVTVIDNVEFVDTAVKK